MDYEGYSLNEDGTLRKSATMPTNLPSLDEARAMGIPSEETTTTTTTTTISHRRRERSSSGGGSRRRRRRPSSAGRARSRSSSSSSSSSFSSSSSPAQRSTSRRRRPASAGRVRSTTTQRLRSSSSAPAFQPIQVKSHPFLNHGGGGGISRKRVRASVVKSLENQWNSEFAQNINANKLVLANEVDRGEGRRREWMNHNHEQFNALNQLRRAIHLKKQREDDAAAAAAAAADPTFREKKKKKKKTTQFLKRQKKQQQQQRKKKNKTLLKNGTGSSSSSNLTMSGKTRMRTRRLIGGEVEEKSIVDTPKKRTPSKSVLSSHKQRMPPSSAKKTMEEMKFVKKCSQIRSLFDDLKIPQRDRRFFTKTFMARYDERSSAFVDEQLEILQNHRHHTLRVLACIRRRETSIKQLHAVVKACVIALVTPEMERSRGRGGRGGGEEEVDSELVVSGALSPDQVGRFRAILIDAARRAKEMTCDVVEAIIPWRKDFWRPHPFKWKSKNYLLRIGKYVGLQKFVTDPNYTKALKRCQIPTGSFDLLLPDDVCEELCTGGTEGLLVREVPSSSSSSPLTEERIASAKVTIEKEVGLVENLAVELERLLSNGYFIPRLRWNPNKLKVSAVVEGEEEEKEEGGLEKESDGTCDASDDDDREEEDKYEDDF